MKIKTITCHDVYNYGASLQAYALQTYLLSLGHDVEIIDYKPSYMKSPYEFWIDPHNPHLKRISKYSYFVRFAYCYYRHIKIKNTFGRKEMFDSFKKEKLACTKKYASIEELKQDAPEADCYIAGSDQIWNTKLKNGHDASFFLQFGSDSEKRLSYAASFGLSDYDEEQMGHMREWLPKFDAISVREKAGLSLLSMLGVDDAVEVLDPVFLLTAEEWTEIATQSKINITEPYILVYDIFVDDDTLKNAAIKLAKKHNLKLVAVNDKKSVDYVDKNVNDAGPAEFIHLIKNAEYVFSNSFHATAFSVIFNRELFVYYYKTNSSRMKNILDSISSIDRLNSEDVCNVKQIDWIIANESIRSMIDKSKQFLSNNL